MLATVLIFLCYLVISSCSNDELAPVSYTHLWMGVLFAFLLIFTFGFAFNSVQSNTICAAFEEAFNIPPSLMGCLLYTSTLGKRPERIKALLSANILKNAMGVGIPGTGMIGLPIAIALGALIGKSEYQLEVLKAVSYTHLSRYMDLF